MKEAFRYIEKNRDKLMSLTKRLISIPTVNPPGENYERIVSLLERECRQIGLATRRITLGAKELKRYGIKAGSPRISLLAKWDIGAKKTIHLNGHYDVVPAVGRWNSPAFGPVVRGGRIYGRGSEDMKGNIASILMAVASLKSSGVVPHCNVELSFTPDEETGGKPGFGYLVDKGIVKPDYAIGEGCHNDLFSYGNKGMVWFKIEVLGKSCHSSEPYKGVNSFEKMVKVANELIKLKDIIARRRTSHETQSDIDKHPTMVLGGELWGGSKTNIVPDKSVFTIDRRLLPEEDLKDAKDEVLTVIERLKKKDKELRVKVGLVAEESPVISERDNMLFKEFAASVSAVRGTKARSALLAGGTDMRFLIRKGIPCVGYSPDGGHSCHGDNEYVKIKSLVDTAKVLARVIARVR